MYSLSLDVVTIIPQFCRKVNPLNCKYFMKKIPKNFAQKLGKIRRNTSNFFEKKRGKFPSFCITKKC